jgi:DNA (cytosine-5)-methyltransferase 1
MADVITAGFPCQPFSCAGKRQGEDDDRNMWPETLRCIRTVRPRFCFLENVPGLISCGYLATVLGDLAESGYDSRWRVLSAAEVGAPHKRDRLWIVADAKCIKQRRYKKWRPPRSCWWEWEPLEAIRNARKGRGKKTWLSIPESKLGRVAHGVAHRVDRLKALGNGQVPLVAAVAWCLLTEDWR